MRRRLKMERNDNGDEPGQGTYPERQDEPDCIYYLRTGTCGYGTTCRFNHPSNAGRQVYGGKNISELPDRPGTPNCGYYIRTGTCKYGSTCKYHHPKDRQVDSLVLLNAFGLPMRQNARPCPFYMRTGICKYGYSCKYHHPQPTTSASVLPVSLGSAVLPSDAPSVGELSEASLSNATYLSGSLLQLPQSYVPFILSLSQGWNTYMGTLSPLSVTSVLTSPASSEQISVSYFPERTNQPECRDFMTRGRCKYGSDCKYHHSTEKISESASSSLGPLGLPLRSGQPICSYYSRYGLCKYGPTCKFDHPWDGYTCPYGSPSHSTPYQTEKSPSSKPLKLSDWVQKGSTTNNNNNKNRDSKAKCVGDLPDRPDSLLSPSTNTSSECTINESD